MDFKEVKEQSRTYIFPNNQAVRFDNVIKIAVPGTTHRLELADGKKYIVNKGWLAISLDVPEWSF